MFFSDFLDQIVLEPEPNNLDQGWETCGPRELDMARNRIFDTQVIAQHRVKTKIHDKQALR